MLATLNIQQLNQIVFGRLKSDAAGGALRVALGVGVPVLQAGAACVIPATALNATKLPPAPFVALRIRPLTAVGIVRANYTWFLYDDPAFDSYRLNALVPLIAQAYAAPLSSPAGAAINHVEFGLVGEAFPDPALGRVAMALPITVFC